jgi:arylsulfatase A-like enzyme
MQVVSNPVSALDLLPTILHAITHRERSAEGGTSALDGASLLPLLHLTSTASPPPHRPPPRVLYWRFNATCRAAKSALLQGSYKWLRTDRHTETYGEGHGHGGVEEELYDVSRDENETLNLATLTPRWARLTRHMAALHHVWERGLPPIHNRWTDVSISDREGECARREQQVARNKVARRSKVAVAAKH